MIMLSLTLKYRDIPVFIVAQGLAVQKNPKKDSYDRPIEGAWDGCYVVDSYNNNGGWKVKESYEEVVAMIKKQLESKGE